jgi:heme/copper-type cytochrome/quinol oxidase subunit 2
LPNATSVGAGNEIGPRTATCLTDTREARVSAGWVNLIVLAAIVVIVAGVAAVFFMRARRRGGRKRPGLAKPPSAHHRRVNPKTGDLFR